MQDSVQREKPTGTGGFGSIQSARRRPLEVPAREVWLAEAPGVLERSKSGSGWF